MKLIVACDVQIPDELEQLVKSTADLDEVAGFKLGALTGLGMGLRTAVQIVRASSEKMVIYDHQKAGNDIPDITQRLVELARLAGVQGIIAFPFAGPLVLRIFVKACYESGVTAIVGGHMTHEAFRVQEGGFIDGEMGQTIMQLASELGVCDFVLPGNQPHAAKKYADFLRARVQQPRFWCPGIGRQGGSPSDLREAVGDGDIFVIVGSSLYLADDPRQAARALAATPSN